MSSSALARTSADPAGAAKTRRGVRASGGEPLVRVPVGGGAERSSLLTLGAKVRADRTSRTGENTEAAGRVVSVTQKGRGVRSTPAHQERQGG